MSPQVVFQAALVAGALAAVGGIFAWSRWRAPREGFKPLPEALCALVAVLSALAATRPYLQPAAVGAGDAYHYALQAADFDAQVDAGVFPVLVGQSAYGFNGNIHTLRTAPYYVHLCGALDRMTAGKLSPYALQNLAAVLTALAAAASMFLVVRTLKPSGALLPALLAGLYVTAPGVAGPLLGRDMFATFMAMPWIPLVVLGSVQCVEARRIGGPLALAVGALALVWYAHPPTGILLCPVLVLAVVLRFVRGPERALVLASATLAAIGFLVLTAYLLRSVESMRLGYMGPEEATNGLSVISELPLLWPGLLLPVTGAGLANTDLQPGYVVLVLAGVGLLGIRGYRWRGILLAGSLACYALAFIPSPLSAWFWANLPGSVASVVVPWPHQRVMPIVSALAIISAVAGIGRLPARAWGLTAGALVLGLGLSWNLHELVRFTVGRTRTGDLTLDGQNVSLTRSSYLLFGEFPDYYSNGPMDPSAETRLLGPDLRLAGTNAGHLLGDPQRDSGWAPIGQGALQIQLEPGKGCALEFKFGDPAQAGEIDLESGGMRRFYTLPLSGMRLGFGSSAGADHTLLVDPGSMDGKTLSLRTTVPGVSFRYRLYSGGDLPFRVTSLIPFTARIRCVGPGFLETPRVYIPGYRASVNGVQAQALRSPQSLVMVPVPEGESTVIVDYAGPPLLVFSYYVSLIGLVAWPFVTATLYRRRASAAPSRRPWVGRWLPATFVAAAALAAMAAYRIHALLPISPGGSLVLTVDFPRQPGDLNEPLVVLGKTGAADVVYVRYVDPSHYAIGYDHWGVGGLLSEPIAYVPGQRSSIEVALPALESIRSGAAPGRDAATRVRADGRDVLGGHFPWYPAAAKSVFVGRNPVGASSCSPEFSGRIRAEGSR